MDYNQVIGKIKTIMSDQTPSVGVNWVLKTYFDTDDINVADQIAWLMFENREYIQNTNGHGDNDVFVVKNPQYEKEKLDLKNAKRISQTYWVTFALALFGFLISLVLLILKLKGL